MSRPKTGSSAAPGVTEQSCVRAFSGTAQQCQNAHQPAGERHLVRLLRGSRMTTVDGVFAEFAAAFQFPWYFGHNWDALDECLTDLDWLPPFDRITVVILSANDVLRDDPEPPAKLLSALEDCGRAWRDPSLRDINATAVVEFEVVLNGDWSHSIAHVKSVPAGPWQS